MRTMEEKAEIRYAVLVEGKSQRQVARESGYSRNTIRRLLEDSGRPKYQLKEPRASRVLGAYKELLGKWVEEDSQKAKKVRRTARRMYDLLQKEHGYGGAEATVRGYVGQLRKQVRHKLYVTLAYAPGECGQVDFGEAEVTIAGKMVRVHLFVMWLGYSGATFVQAYPGETQEVFFAGHVAAFEFFGGVPQALWYDNLSDAVQKVLTGWERDEQESFISFRTHYLFKAEFCNVASGWEKGGVEGRVGYVRRNWLIGAGEFASWEALNEQLRQQCQAEQGRCLPRRTESIGARLEVEQAALRTLPVRPYPCCKTVAVKANHLSLVTYRTNRYSVPVDKAHAALTLHAYVDRIEIVCGSEVVASHVRSWGREQDLLNPYHYLPLLAQKPRAFAQAQVIRQWRSVWPVVFDHYFEQLKTCLPTAEATRRFVEILKLGEQYSESEVATALSEALSRCCWEVAGIRELLRRGREGARPPTVLLLDHPQLAAVQVKVPDLTCFNQLLTWRREVAA
jgi:transposase